MPIPPLETFAGASLVSLEELELKALNQSANFSKDVRHGMEQWVEQLAVAMIARWLIEQKRATAPHPPHQLVLPL